MSTLSVKNVLGGVKNFFADALKPSDKAYEAYSSGRKKEKGAVLSGLSGGAGGGAVAGSFLGGVLGGLIGHNSAMQSIQKLPINTVTLDWDKPLMGNREIGKIPADYYEPNNIWGGLNPHTMKSVIVSAPVLNGNGQPIMQHTENTWTKHGEPLVSWQDKNINDPFLKGYRESRFEENHTEKVQVGTDRYGDPVYYDVTRVDGWEHRFSPEISYKTLGTFKEPKVTFETGVNVGLRTTLGVLAGAVGGALVGAIVVSAIKKASE